MHGMSFCALHQRADGIPSVAFVCGRIPGYRVPFFERLRSHLARKGIELRVLAGTPSALEATKGDSGSLAWAEPIEPRSITFGSRSLVWQPVMRAVRNCDLVVVEQASRYLVNLPLLAWQHAGGPAVAFWGHGYNHGADASRSGERVKRIVSRQPAWWFAYTEGVADAVEQLGYERRRITVAQNASDSEALARARSSIGDAEAEVMRRDLGVRGTNVALFVGSLYAERRLEFLLEAATLVRSAVRNFELIIVGSGPDERVAQSAAKRSDWIHYASHRAGRELAAIGALSKLLVMPGPVGLVAVDAFSLGLPLVTTSYPWHAPEIEYLRHGENGWIVSDWQNPQLYADAVARLLVDESARRELVAGCAASAARISLDEMVRRFSQGIETALNVGCSMSTSRWRL